MGMDYAISRVRRHGNLVMAQERGFYYEEEFATPEEAEKKRVEVIARTLEAREGIPCGYFGNPDSIDDLKKSYEEWCNNQSYRAPVSQYA